MRASPIALPARSRAQGRGGHHRRALEVLVHHGNPQRAAEAAEDVEAFRRADVLQVHAAEGGLEQPHRLDEAVRVARVEFQVEPVEVGQALEQHGRALEHRLRHERADIAEPRHGRPVGDDADEIGLGGVAEHGLRVGLDGRARKPRARQCRQPHVARRQAAFDRPDLDLPWAIALVVRKRFLAPDHGWLSFPPACGARGNLSRVSCHTIRVAGTGRTCSTQSCASSKPNSISTGWP